MANSKHYVVAPGYTLIFNGRIYEAGDEVKEKDVKDKSVWARLIRQKKLIEKKDSSASAAEAVVEDSADASTAKETEDKE